MCVRHILYRHGVTYRKETKQPLHPIAGLPLLEFSPALGSWSDIYMGPNFGLSFHRRFPLLFFIWHLYLSVTRLGCSLKALSSISRVDTPLIADWLKVCIGTHPQLSFLKCFWKIAYSAFNCFCPYFLSHTCQHSRFSWESPVFLTHLPPPHVFLFLPGNSHHFYGPNLYE